MAVEIDVKKMIVRAAPEEPLTHDARVNLTHRRRRLRRLHQALVTAAWVGGSTILLFFAAAEFLSLR